MTRPSSAFVLALLLAAPVLASEPAAVPAETVVAAPSEVATAAPRPTPLLDPLAAAIFAPAEEAETAINPAGLSVQRRSSCIPMDCVDDDDCARHICLGVCIHDWSGSCCDC